MGFGKTCTNNGFDDRWTCPGCYYDLDGASKGSFTCPKCNAKLTLTVEYQVQSVATIADADEENL